MVVNISLGFLLTEKSQTFVLLPFCIISFALLCIFLFSSHVNIYVRRSWKIGFYFCENLSGSCAKSLMSDIDDILWVNTRFRHDTVPWFFFSLRELCGNKIRLMALEKVNHCELKVSPQCYFLFMPPGVRPIEHFALLSCLKLPCCHSFHKKL